MSPNQTKKWAEDYERIKYDYERIKAEAVRQIVKARAELSGTVRREGLTVSARPDLREPAFRDPTPVDPMFQRFALILA